MSLNNFPQSQSQDQRLADVETRTVFKHYELRRTISATKTAVVYEAWDRQLHRTVAIKQIFSVETSRETLLKEARLAASLNHPAFVKIHAIEEEGDHLYIVMEMVQGTSLHSWIQEHHGKERQVLGHILQLATAMQEAHALGLAHGDIKPANLIIDRVGKVRILNFGLVGHQERNTNEVPDLSDPNSSIAYMAPERFSNNSPTAAGDVFALGIVWYEMLRGALPHAGLSGLALVAAQVQIASEQWFWPENIGEGQRRLIGALTSGVAQRYTSAQLMQEIKLLTASDPLSNSLNGLSRDALQAQLKSEARQRHWRVAMVLALVSVVLVVATWQAQPYWPQIVKALKPYSESREVEQGTAYLLQYTINRSNETLDAASAHFTTVLERNPEQASAVACMSLIYLFRYNAAKRDEIWLQRAKASAQQALKIDRNLSWSQIADAQILIHHNKLAQALDAVEKALSLDINNVIAWQTKMTILLLQERFEAAMQWADRGALQFPKDRFLLELKAAIQNRQSDYVAAEQTIRQALLRHPDSSNAYAILSDALVGQERFSDALQALQQGLQIQPSAMQYSTMGRIRFLQGEYAAAASAYKNAVSPNQGVNGSYLRWMQYAEALMWTSDGHDEGMKAYQKAKDLLELRLNRAPDDANLLMHMSLIVIRLGDRSVGLNYTKQALEISPDSGEILIGAAINYALLGDRNKALQLVALAKKHRVESSLLSHPILNSLNDGTHSQLERK
jgi:serine/threonine protein kinase/Flp pilus assembly protein TadD